MGLHIWLIRALSHIVPRRFRSEWTKEWEAELQYRELRRGRDVFRRSLGSFWDALAMQPRRLEDETIQDVRFGLRTFWKNKALSATVIFCLALGIGANSAIFSAIDGLLMKKLSVQNPDTLVRFRYAGRNQMALQRDDYGYREKEGGLDVRATFSYAIFKQFRENNQTLTGMFACAPLDIVNVVADGQAEIASAFIASGDYHSVLGVKPLLGRMITSLDDDPAATPVAVISAGYWARRFGSNRDVIGKTVQVNGVPITIVGVEPQDFTGVQRANDTPPDLSLPLTLENRLGQKRLGTATAWWLEIMGRLKPGVTPVQAQGAFDGMFRQTAREGLDSYLRALSDEERARSANQNRTQIPHLRVNSGARGLYDVPPDNIQTVVILSVVVGLILLLVCANVANLLLSRAARRQTEMSMRVSLGASRLRLIRQLLTESVLLAVMGGAGGLLIGYWGKQLLPGELGAAPLDWQVVAFTFAMTVLTGILFGTVPALRATRHSLSDALKAHSRTLSGSRTWFGNALLVFQVGISLVLLIGAGLFLNTVNNLRHVSIGFNPNNVILFRTDPSLSGYSREQAGPLYREIATNLEAVPGARAVSLSNVALLSGAESSTDLFVANQPCSPCTPSPQTDVDQLTIGPKFFETMEIPIFRGRNFTKHDSEGAPKVAIVNEAAARKFFPNEDPIGRKFGTSPEKNNEFEVVGLVRDVRYNSVREPAPPTVYWPYMQRLLVVFHGAVFEVRIDASPASAIKSIREAVRKIDPNLPLMRVATQVDRVERRFAQEKLFAQAYVLFGSLALLVASVGLFGLMSYSVARRTKEIGIRIALGAQRASVMRMVMRESLLLVTSGAVMGTIAALAMGRFIKGLLFGLAPTDVFTNGAALFVIISVSVFAGYFPAHRASRTDPLTALHHE
jgi:predicted permease